MDAGISVVPWSDLQDAEQQLKDATTALGDAQLATRAAETVLRERRAEESEAQAAFDRATSRITELFEEERGRLEEAARVADAALKQLESRIRALRPGEAAPSPGRPDAVAELPPPAGPEAVDLTQLEAADPAEDWLVQLQKESERERGSAGDA